MLFTYCRNVGVAVFIIGGAHNGKEFDGYEFTVFNPTLVNSTVFHPD